MALIVFSLDNQISCELYIPNSKELYKKFEDNKEEIENAIGLGNLLWQELPEKKASRIRLYHTFDFQKTKKEEAFKWLLLTATKFKGIFSKNWNSKSNG